MGEVPRVTLVTIRVKVVHDGTNVHRIGIVEGILGGKDLNLGKLRLIHRLVEDVLEATGVIDGNVFVLELARVEFAQVRDVVKLENLERKAKLKLIYGSSLAANQWDPTHPIDDEQVHLCRLWLDLDAL